MQKYYQKLNNILFYILLGLMVFIVVYPKFPLISIKGSAVSIRIEDILIALTLGYWFLLNIPRLKDIVSEKVTKTVLLFWGIGLLSVLSGLFLTFTLTAHLGILNWLRRVEDMSLLFVAWTTVTQKKQAKTVLVVMLVTTILVVLYGFGQQYIGLPVVSTINNELAKGVITKLTNNARPNSTFAGYYDFATYLSMALMFIGAFFFYFRKGIEKVWLAISGALSFIMLDLTAERQAFVATLLSLVALLYLLGKRWLIVALILVSVLAVALVPPLRSRFVATFQVALLHKTGPVYVVPSPSATTQVVTPKVATSEAFLNSIASGPPKAATPSSNLPVDIAPGEPLNFSQLDVYRSTAIRLNVEWPRAIRALAQNPFLGTGYSSITLATDSDYLRSLGETGLFGTAAFVLVLVAILKKIKRLIKSEDKFIRYFSISVITMVLAVLINGLFIDIFEASKVADVFWIIMGVNLALERM